MRRLRTWTATLGLWAAVGLTGFALIGIGSAQAADLVGMLTSQLGVTQKQASDGAGSLFNYAEGQMSAADFDIVSSALPGTGDLMSAAPDSGGGLLDSASSLVGSSDSTAGAAGLASSFSDLGMSADMVGEFVPVVLEYAQGAGGEQVMQLLQGALTGL